MSGSNAFHGDAYEFLRNNIFNANAWGNKLTVPYIARPVYRYNDFGGTLGGPVWIPRIYNGRDKTFFFVSYEGRRFDSPYSGTALVPTASELAGDFSNDYYVPTGSSIASAQGPVAVCTAYDTVGYTGKCTAFGDKITTFSPTAQAYLKDVFSKLPQPNSASDISAGLDPHTVFSSIPSVANNDQIFARIDQQFGKRLTVFVRYLHDTNPSISGGGTFIGTPLAGVSPTITHNPGTQDMVHATYASGTLVIEMGYAYSNNRVFTFPEGLFLSPNSPDVKPALPYASTIGVLPTLSFNGNLTALGASAPYIDKNNNHNGYVNATKVFGRHTVLVGATYDHYEKLENQASTNNQGTFAFTNALVTPPGGMNAPTNAANAFANFLIGNVNNGFTQASTEVFADPNENSLEAYAQDNWKYSPRLTLNLGVRWSYFGQPLDGNGNLSSFSPASFSASKAPAVTNAGVLCLTGTCSNSTAYLPSGVPATVTANASADYQGPAYINGMIFAGNKAANQPSPYGNKVGTAPKLNFAPRVGFAYDVFGDGKTALRGGFGLSFDQSEVSYYEGQISNNPPAVITASGSFVTLDNPTLAPDVSTTAPSTTSLQSIYASPLNYHTPYVEQYSVDIQQNFTQTLFMDIGYFGTHGVKLLAVEDINQPKPNAFIGVVSPLDGQALGTVTGQTLCTYNVTTCPIPVFANTTTERVLNYIRPYQGYGHIGLVNSISKSSYNGLQVKLTKKFGGKSMIDANYTWSRNLTNAQNDYSTDVTNIYNINGDYGRAADDRNQILVVDAIYELPWMKDQKGLVGHVVGGWELSGIWAMDSGLPQTITMSVTAASGYNYGYTSVYNNQSTTGLLNDSAGIGNGYTSGQLGNAYPTQRPNLIGDPRNGNGQQIRTRLQWYYKGAFAAPLPAGLNPGGLGQVGTEGRGVVNGPGFERLDLGIFRNFKIWENVDFQLRGEAYNTLNHTNLGAPASNSMSSSLWDQITSARDNRILQVGGKIRF